MLSVVLIIALSLNCVFGQSTQLTNLTPACMNCICQIESGCKDVGCIMDVGSLSCGYYQIKEPYWIDCGRLGSGWQACARDKTCAENCVRAYLTRYGSRCTGTPAPTCIEFGRIHNGGPNGCKTTATDPYATKLRNCMNSGK